MIRGLYIARAGMLAEQSRADLAGHNLANADTPGYRRRVAATGTFAQLLLERLGDTPTLDRRAAPVGPLGQGPVLALVREDLSREPLPGSSNVDPGQEMVDLMVAVRAYEAQQRVIQAQDAALGKAVNELGRV